MSRIIVKNLPKGMSRKKLEDLFSARGNITDLQLKYNKEGVFRQFAFIGYKTEDEANAAKEYFNGTFVNTSKITVDICNNLGDENKPKPWKKTINTEKVEHKDKQLKKVETKKTPKNKKFDIPEELKDDPQFKEFLGVNEERSSKPVWAEDVDTNLNSDSDEEKSSDSEGSTTEHEESSVSKTDKALNDNLKTSVKVKAFNDMFTVKIRNLPYQCKKSQIKKFFHPLKIISLRLPPRNKGFAYVSFKAEKDLKKALIKHRGFLDGHRVDVIKYAKKEEPNHQYSNKKFNENGKEINEELLAETGRIYIRNLCYSVTEDDIKELFTKYGPAEVHVPIDFSTKKCKGFAFVSFMFAEHAVKAFTELDGKIFQGRLLHLIPAQPKNEFETDENETNYKKKKESKTKKESGSSHNWNILFLGTNAVVDIIAEKHGIEKSKFLSVSQSSKESLAVRVALAETEMVENTRKFLVENGVQLDAFSQPAAERSKTVIVVKHLPAKTTAAEINELFSKHGTVSRVLVPPSGLLALVEYTNPSEARTAFNKLAYKQFHNGPLFLEWAPMGGLKDAPIVQKEVNDEKESSQEDKVKDDLLNQSTEEIPPNAETTIYVRNLSFDITEKALRKHFKQCGKILSATVSQKKDVKSGKTLSMGFGFVQFAKKEHAVYALQNLQQSVLNGRSIEIKFANRQTTPSSAVKRKKYEVKKQTSSKILVRNIPFQASHKEVRDLFKVFGDLKTVRLPKKLGQPNEHRGFGFIEYNNAEDAERAFESLCHSTHLFDRRLVLEWANTDSESVSEIRKKTAENYLERGSKKKLKKSQLREDAVIAATRNEGHSDED